MGKAGLWKFIIYPELKLSTLTKKQLLSEATSGLESQRLVKGNDVYTFFALCSSQKHGGFTTGSCPGNKVVAVFPLGRQESAH